MMSARPYSNPNSDEPLLTSRRTEEGSPRYSFPSRGAKHFELKRTDCDATLHPKLMVFESTYDFPAAIATIVGENVVVER
jgi:hypothetical protein